MIRLAGRFGFDPRACWEMTPGEFEDYVDGGLEREEAAAMNAGIVASMVAASAGATVSPAEAVGLQSDDHGPSPFGEDRQVKYRKHRAMLHERARKRAQEWLPEALRSPTRSER